MDLLGMDTDGALYLWQANAQVQPLSRFPMRGDRIVSGHYTIDVKGHAITVHCSNSINPGWLVVQRMCCKSVSVRMDLKGVEATLMGQVVKDPKEEAEILAMLRQMTADAVARQQALHRRRGQA